MRYKDINYLNDSLKGVLEKVNGSIKTLDESRFRGSLLDRLTFNAVFHEDPLIKGMSRWIIKSAAPGLGVWSASIQPLYEAMGKGDVKGFTVPAINVRGLSYDMARAVIRSAKKHKAGAFIFEIARSEIGYTFQRPGEFAAVMFAAAIKEGYKGPLFIQGDHFQANAKKIAKEPQKEIDALRTLIREAVAAGFYNIDIDTSTLVDLSKPNIVEQQRMNFELAAELTALVREIQPEEITVSVGGEIGEVGGKNSTVEELHAFMDNYLAELRRRRPDLKGSSKISVQTGTTHGGIPLADGTVAEVKLDFATLEKLSKEARERYGMSGAVQHGASTLPDEAFHRFPETRTAEIHLATGFQNMIYEHPAFPGELKKEIYAHLHTACADEIKPGQSEEQFIYKTRKKAFGPFKERLWTLPPEVRDAIGRDLENKFDFLFKKLGVPNTWETVLTLVKPRVIPFDTEAEIKACKS